MLKITKWFPPPKNRITKFNMYPEYSKLVWHHDHFRKMLLKRQIQSICGYFASWNRIHSRDTHTVNSIVINNVVEPTTNIVQPEEASRTVHVKATAEQTKGKHTVNSNIASGLIHEIEGDIVIDVSVGTGIVGISTKVLSFGEIKRNTMSTLLATRKKEYVADALKKRGKRKEKREKGKGMGYHF